MKTYVFLFAALTFCFTTNVLGQNAPDLNLHHDWDLVNCPSSPKIETSFSLSSADNTTWDVGFIMLTLSVDENVLGTPPQILTIPTGWDSDVYKDGTQWQIELVEPTGGSISVSNAPVDFFSIQWDYLSEGVAFSITIDDTDLGVNNSIEDEQLHYPDGLFISGADDCASQTGEIDFYWNNPTLSKCPGSPTLTTPISLASHFPGEVWANSFIQLIIEQDNNILSTPRVVNSMPGWTASVYPMFSDWVIELSSSINDTITDQLTQVFEIEWDYLQEGIPFTVNLFDIDLGLNVPNEIVHRPNGNSISGNPSCPCDVKILYVATQCTNACEGKATIFFDIEISNGPGGLIEISAGGINSFVNTTPGDLILLDESLNQVSFVNQPVIIIATIVGMQCSDTFKVPQITCGPCDITINSISPSPCDPSTNKYNLAIDVSVKDLCNGFVSVELDGNTPVQYMINNNVVMISDLPADGTQHTIRISDSQLAAACRDEMNYSAPAACHISSNSNPTLNNTQVAMYPNPPGEDLIVHIESEILMNSLHVFNMAGQEMITAMLSSENYTLNVSHLTSGIYFITIRTTSGLIIEKLSIH